MKVMTTENVMLHLHGKNQAKLVFSKNPCVFTILINFFKKRNNSAIITGRIPHEMMVFTMHLLRAQER